jgi:hypothetical protein
LVQFSDESQSFGAAAFCSGMHGATAQTGAPLALCCPLIIKRTPQLLLYRCDVFVCPLFAGADHAIHMLHHRIHMRRTGPN